MEDYESVLLVLQQCFVYQVPPLLRSEGHRASNWNVENFLWKGRLRIVTKNEKLTIKLEDSLTGELFAACPYDDKGLAVEQVLDSSRYFVIRVADGDRHAYLGLGFEDRSEAFDFNVTLQDFLRHKNQANEPEVALPSVDYSLKEGQTISLNLGGKINKKKTTTEETVKPFVLPPPPQTTHKEEFSEFQSGNNDDFDGWAKF